MKKAYLSISALLAALVLSGCSPIQETSSETGSSAGSSVEASSAVETSSSTESSSEEDVFTYELSVVAPSVTTYEVGDTFDFSAIAVSLTTYKNGKIDGAAATLSRDEYIVKVNGQTVDGNFTFSEKGEVEFAVSSKAHPEASKSFKLTAEKHYTITNGSADKVVLTGLPEKAEAGDAVSFGLTLLPGYYFEGTIKITKNDGTAVEFTDDDNYGYSFVMPEGNVVITVGADLTDFTISKDDELIGNIVYEDAEDETKSVFSATAGTELKFKTLDSIDYSFTKVFIDGVEASVGEDGYYHFSMPHHPVVISTDKGPRDYNIESNTDSLTLSTVTMYTDAEAKTPITKAHKGQTVYLKMSYEVTLVKYSISITDSEDSVVAAAQDETDPTLFSFTMISSDLEIVITEDDWSTYAGYYVTDKVWKGFYAYEPSSTKVEAKAYSDMTSSSYQYEFYGNGKGKKGTYNSTWTTTASASDTSGLVSIDYSYSTSYSTYSYTDKAFYYTAHMFATKGYDSSSYDWTNVTIGTWDENTTIHTIGFGKRRIVWVQDKEGNITEKMFINASNVYTNFGFYTDSTKTTLVKGSDITGTINAYVEVPDVESFELVEGKYTASYGLTAQEDDSYSIVFKDADGNAITSAKNGSTVYLYGSLKEGVDSSITIKSPTVTYGDNKSVTVTAVSGQENVWSFTMPEGDVSASLTLNNPNKMAGHAALGTYYGFNLYSSTKDDRDYAQKSQTAYTIAKDGTFKEGSSSYDVTSFDTAARGNITLSSDKTWSYGGEVIARPYNSSYDDVYVAIRVADGGDPTKIKTKVHWMSGISWAIEFYSYTDDSETFVGGIFQTGKKFYMGVTFEMTGNSTRIEADATYNVKMDGQTIFTVANNTVTAVE